MVREKFFKSLTAAGVSLEKVLALHPSQFIAIAIDVVKDKECEVSAVAFEGDARSVVKLRWNEKGVYISIHFDSAFQDVFYPEFTQGDAVEIFLDTRDMKQMGRMTRFCHHFLALPKKINGVQALELSRFRNEDAHEHCDPKDIGIKTEFAKKSFIVKMELPQEILYGYNPNEFRRLGFAYRIHRKGFEAEQFPLPMRAAPLEKYPGYWSTLHLL